MTFAHALLTDVGQIRERNEDLAWADPGRGLFLLADGMGGHPNGNVASKIAIDAAREYLTSTKVPGRPRNRGDRLAQAILAANSEIVKASQSDANNAGMGTTLVCAWLGLRSIHIAHVGDSRLYRIRDGKATVLTRDHTVAFDLISRGLLDPNSLEAHHLGHILTQAVGLEDQLNPDVAHLPVTAGDTYLLCSDGLTDMVTDETIGSIVADCNDDMTLAAHTLVSAALDGGGLDNITVLVARVP